MCSSDLLVWILAPEISFADPVGMDYDGDGEKLHAVAFFYDWLTGTLTNTGIAVDSWSGFPFFPTATLSERRAGYVALEKVDENGDGDTDDRLLHVFDARTGTSEPTGLVVWREAGMDMDPLHLVCAAFDGPDLLTGRIVDVSTRAQQGLGFSSVKRLSLAEEHVLIAVYESVEGVDLNADGDLEDIVQQVHDLATVTTFNTAVAVTPSEGLPAALELENGRLALLVPEFDQGRDLNEDGDMLDLVLHVVRLP